MSNNRVAAGVPTGGQFAPDVHARSSVALTEDLFGDQAPPPTVDYVRRSQCLAGEDHSYENLAGRDLSRADARAASFLSANLAGADLSGVDARGADFTKAEMTGVNIGGADFSEAILRDANLAVGMDSVDFSRADLSEAVIGPGQGVNFAGADLRDATLSGAFEDCDFRGANLAGAWARGRGYANPRGMPTEPATFLDCRFDDDLDVSGGTFPDGFDPARDARFRAQGFTPDETHEWAVENGWDSASDAAAWKNEGFNPAEAADLAGQGVTAEEAGGYRAHGVLDAAADWKRAGVPGEEVQSWTDAGFSAGDHLPPNEDAGHWAATGLTPATAEAWAEGRYLAHEAVSHTGAGLTPATAPEPEYDRARRQHYETVREEPLASLRRWEASSRRALQAALGGTLTASEWWSGRARCEAITQAIADRSQPKTRQRTDR